MRARVDALRAVLPGVELVLREDAPWTTLTCVDTAHAVSWRDDAEAETALEAMRRHVGGKKCARAVEARRRAGALREYEPHIVRSAYVEGYVFCRVTGSRVRATEEEVVKHASGRRFARAHAAALRSGTLLDERSPEEEEREREKRRVAAKAVAKAAADARLALKEQKAAEKAKKRAEKKRTRENGGFDEEMGCWKPPADVIGGDEDDEDEEEDEDETTEDEEDEEHNDLEDDFYDDDDSEAEEYSSDEDDEDDVAIVRRPGFGKKRRTK